jgi:hypothetical protein
MLKRLALAAAIGLGAGSIALAQNAPTSTDDCFKMSMELFKSADAGKLADDKRTKVEELLEKIEGHCDAKQFAEAASAAKDAKAIIEGK